MEELGVIISFLALIVAAISLGVSFFFRNRNSQDTRRSLEQSDKALRYSAGNFETGVRAYISTTRDRMTEALWKFQERKEDFPNADLTKYKGLLYGYIEDYLNAYDRACMLYLDGKIDQVRFQKEYQREIRRAVEDIHDREHFFPANRVKFEALQKVYAQFESKE